MSIGSRKWRPSLGEGREKPAAPATAGDRAGIPSEPAATGPAGAAPVPVTAARAIGSRLGEVLTRQGAVTSAQVAEALLQQPVAKKRLGELLVDIGAVEERAVARALGEQFGLPVIDLRREEPEPAALERLPEAVARGIGAVPIRLADDRLEVAVADPLDGALLGRITTEVGGTVSLLIAPLSDIRRAIDNSYRALSDVDQLVESFQATEVLERDEPEDEVAVDDAPVVQVVNRIITQALRDRASDIHVEPQAGRVRIRYRIDGALHDVLALPESMGTALVSRLKIMARMNIVERRRPQDGQISMEVDGRPLDIRVNTSPHVWGEKTVLRLLDRNRTLLRLDDLGLPPELHASYSRLVRSPFGMVICAGPTGSGKTTTLYATLSEINSSERNIVTIEDPVEYLFPSINQMQINEPAGVTFAEGLRSILRQDPDVILVGEIRDVETARIAVESALTGHLVLSSMHATDAGAALERFLDMGIEPFLVASTVIGVVSQRLVRRICRSCRAPYQPTLEEMAFYTEAGGPAKPTFWQGEGCNFCARTGYRDRIGVFELLRMNDDLKRVIIGHGGSDELRSVAASAGAAGLLREGVQLVSEDVTTIAEIIRTLYSA